MNPLVTVIIPTFKRPHLINKAIESVLNQTHPDFQICIYDNASGDETAEVVRSYMKKDPRIKYHCHAENIGMMANYEFALARVNTEYFVFLSDDDLFFPHFLETALKGFKSYPDAAFSACNVHALNERGDFIYAPMEHWRKEGYFKPLECIEQMILHPFIPIGVLFNHRIVKEVKIDTSKEIQLRWDPDYLLRVIIQFPYLVNKQLCGLFLIHPQGYSTLINTNIFSLFENFRIFFAAVKKSEENALAALVQRPTSRRKARSAYDQLLKPLLKRKIRETHERDVLMEYSGVLAMYKERFGTDFITFKDPLKKAILSYAPWILTFKRFISRICKHSLGKIQA